MIDLLLLVLMIICGCLMIVLVFSMVVCGGIRIGVLNNVFWLLMLVMVKVLLDNLLGFRLFDWVWVVILVIVCVRLVSDRLLVLWMIGESRFCLVLIVNFRCLVL